MRLIDADKLHYSRIRIAHSDGTIGGYNAVVMSVEIKDAPTVDAVPVVRCKDCKYYGRVDKRRFYRGSDCIKNIINTIVHDTDFCSRGEQNEQ